VFVFHENKHKICKLVLLVFTKQRHPGALYARTNITELDWRTA
jgi:hypothetical protein